MNSFFALMDITFLSGGFSFLSLFLQWSVTEWPWLERFLVQHAGLDASSAERGGAQPTGLLLQCGFAQISGQSPQTLIKLQLHLNEVFKGTILRYMITHRHHLRIRVVPPCCCLLSVSVAARWPACLWITTAAPRPPLPPSWPPCKCCCPSITPPPTCSVSRPHPGECAHLVWMILSCGYSWKKETWGSNE